MNPALGTKRPTMLVYVIGAQPTGFSPANGTSGSNFPNDSYQWSEEFTNWGGTHPEVFGPFPECSYPHWFFSLCQIEFKVKPDILYSDAQAGLLNPAPIAFAVCRDARVRIYWETPNGPNWATDSGYSFDDGCVDSSDSNPWADGHGFVYGNDFPACTKNLPDATTIRLMYNWAMREYVRAKAGTSKSDTFVRCSDYKYWHCARGAEFTGGVWQRWGAQEIAEGELVW